MRTTAFEKAGDCITDYDEYYVAIPLGGPSDRGAYTVDDFRPRRNAFVALIRFFAARCDEFVMRYDASDPHQVSEVNPFLPMTTQTGPAAQFAGWATEVRGPITDLFLQTVLSAPPGSDGPSSSPIFDFQLQNQGAKRFACGDYDDITISVGSDELAQLERILENEGIDATFVSTRI